MAHKGVGFFDGKGQFYKTPEDATLSDLSAMLGKIGEGDSLAPGIAFMLLEKRADIERIFTEHDTMRGNERTGKIPLIEEADNVSVLPDRKPPKLEQAS